MELEDPASILGRWDPLRKKGGGVQNLGSRRSRLYLVGSTTILPLFWRLRRGVFLGAPDFRLVSHEKWGSQSDFQRRRWQRPRVLVRSTVSVEGCSSKVSTQKCPTHPNEAFHGLVLSEMKSVFPKRLWFMHGGPIAQNPSLHNWVIADHF